VDLSLTIAPELEGRVRVGVAHVVGLKVGETDPGLRRAIEDASRELRSRYSGRAPGEIPEVAEARTLYKALGLDPTKTRPSNEALLRRVLKGESLYVVNTLVDAVNLASLQHQLPFGLYDALRLRPPLTLRRGAEGEGYPGIRKGNVNLAGRPLLADPEGPFGNPSADAARTAIRLDTKEAVVVAYAPSVGARERLDAALSAALDHIVRFCGGTVGIRLEVPAA